MEDMINQCASCYKKPMKDSACFFTSEDHFIVVESYQISNLAPVILFSGILEYD